MAADNSPLTADSLKRKLANDGVVKVAAIDIDGILRGKVMAKDKFLASIKSGFGFCSVVFAWDMHDRFYEPELAVSTRMNGYRDVLATIDLASFRRIPWEHNIPFFLVSFVDPKTERPLAVCPRQVLRRALAPLTENGRSAYAGLEYEYFHFRVPTDKKSGRDSLAAFLQDRPPSKLPVLTDGMFGYSLTRPLQNQDYYYGVLNNCQAFRCPIESYHSESGPGVFEAALAYTEAKEMADRASLFKFTVKALGHKHGILPCFMAKPHMGMPGSSGHVHISLRDEQGTSLFVREEPDENAPWPDVKHVSDFGRHFLAGVLDGLPDVMPLLAPTVNSYKRLVENFFAPVALSWALEHRAASVRVIAPPVASAAATRFEVRVPGADANPHLVLAAVIALGLRGVEKKLTVQVPPLGCDDDAKDNGKDKVDPLIGRGQRLPKSLADAVARFAAPGSVARQALGDEFVDHFAGTRNHELRLWNEAVTDWEIQRYIETV